jgi:HEAT repeat protein
LVLELAAYYAVALSLAAALFWSERRLDLLPPSVLRWFAAQVEEASRGHDIRFRPRSRWSRTAIGTCDDFSVRVELRRDPSTRWDTYRSLLCVTISGLHIAPGVAFARERGTGDDVLTGDTGFDDSVEVRGEPRNVLALLNWELRHRVSEFVRLGGRLRDGALTCCVPNTFSSKEIAHPLSLGLALAHELSSPGDSVCKRLARNATSDPQPGVRLSNLLELHESFAHTAEASEASRTDLKDRGPWVRLAAARFLKDESLDVLENLAAHDHAVPAAAAAEAVALVAARSSAPRAAPFLMAILKTRSGEVRRQAVEELGRIQYRPAQRRLTMLLEHADARTAAAVAAALGALGDLRAEHALLQAVQNDAREVRLAAVHALGKLGHVSAVEPLLAFLDTRRPDAETRQGIRDAIGAIQSRLVGAEAGQISIAANAHGSGWLSVAPSAREGDVSLVADGKKG